MSPAKAGQEQVRGKDGRFKPGHSGNPRGKKPGTKHKATEAALALLAGETEALTRKAIDLAKEGNLEALRLCLSRLVPPAKDKPITLEMPPVNGPQDAARATAALLESVCRGELSPGEAQTVAGLLEVHRKTLEVEELERRVAALEESR